MALFGELAYIIRNGNNSVSCYLGNGQKGLAVISPVVKSQESFLEQAGRKIWIEKMLPHMSGGAETDMEDAAQWLGYYLGKIHVHHSHLLVMHLVYHWLSRWMM
jgi:hypothetical protein